METRRPVVSMESCVIRARLSFHPLLIFFILLAGCGAPGDPAPPRPAVPVAISDLTAVQSGESVRLKFTLPLKTIYGETLVQPPTIEIYREFLPQGASPKKLAARLVYTVPSALVNTILAAGSVEFNDPIGPAETAAHSGEQVFYFVRTRAAQKRASADSNVIAVQLVPVPEPITPVEVSITETAVELTWKSPALTSSSGTAPQIIGYRVYRAEVDTASGPVQDPAKVKLKTPLALIASPTTPAYLDTQVEFDRTYLYSIRTVSAADSLTVESSDSAPVIITRRDIFPPAPPQRLVAVVVPAVTDVPAHIELSWGISSETDLAGYYVYRSEEEGARGKRITPDLLPAPTYRDMSVVPGRRYKYHVTAVDRAGNESAASDLVSIELP